MLTKQVSLFPAYLKSLRLRKIFDFIILWSLALQPAQDPSPLKRFFFFFLVLFRSGSLSQVLGILILEAREMGSHFFSKRYI